jgi:uncharacterized protein YuzE
MAGMVSAMTAPSEPTPEAPFRATTTPHAAVRHEPEAHALYIRYGEGEFCFTAQIGEGRYLDYSTDARVLGIEILDTDRGVDLEGIPFGEEVGDALEALGLTVLRALPTAKARE